jgi:glucose/arabinose dehydrogenase
VPDAADLRGRDRDAGAQTHHRGIAMLHSRLRNAALAVALLAGFGSGAMAATPLTTVQVASGLTRPLFVTAPPGDDRIFIVEQRGADNKGRIKILKNGTVQPVPFLTTNTLASGNEEGLLGLAFPPNYAQTRAFYIYYTDTSGNNHVARHRVGVNSPDKADSIGTNVLTLLHPTNSNHNGGWIAFGPDGYLYVATGDGGGAGDTPNNAQNINSFLGKMLRLAVDTTGTYTSPPTNPFVGVAGLDEIWAIGLRNPFRDSFDRETHDLIIGDVGQNLIEEVDFVPYATGPGRGFNFGWSCYEGNDPFNTVTTPCTSCTNTGCFWFPAYTYPHTLGRCSITGGYVYRGCAIPDLRGTYFFADYCGAQIYSGKFVGNALTNFAERTIELDPAGAAVLNQITSFGEDANGEIYVCDQGGQVYKIVPNGPVAEADQPALRTQTVLGDTLGTTGYGNALGTGIVPFVHAGSRVRGVGYLKDATKRGCESVTATGYAVGLTLGSWDIDYSATVAPDSATLTQQYVFINRAGGAAELSFRDVVAPTLENDPDQGQTYAPSDGNQSALLVVTDADAPARYLSRQGYGTGSAYAQDVDAASAVEARVAADQPLSGSTAATGAIALALGFDFGSVAPAARETVVVVTRLWGNPPLDAGDPSPLTGSRILRALGPMPFSTRLTFVIDAPSGTGLKSLDVFDARGRRVVRLASPQVLTGPRTIAWDGRDSGGARVPSGLYFVRARTTLGDETLRAVRVD